MKFLLKNMNLWNIEFQKKIERNDKKILLNFQKFQEKWKIP